MSKLSIIALALLSVAAAHAGTVAVTAFVDPALSTAATDQLYGWFFDTSSAITVTDLGVFDEDSDGLVNSHDVGIFRVSDQALLISSTIPSGTAATLLNGFRYVSVTPLVLPASSYVIVTTMPADSDGQNIEASSVTTSAPVTWVTSAFDAGSVLAYPTLPGLFDVGMFGPNFQFEGSAAQTPEPGSMLLLTTGALALAFIRRRRI